MDLFTYSNSFKSLTTGAYADPDYREIFMMSNFRWDDLYSDRRESLPPWPVRDRGFCFFIKLAAVPHPGKRGRECTLGKAGTYEAPKSSRREEAWYEKLENSVC